MDEFAKRAIKKTILALRKLLEQEDIPAVLKQHGIFPDVPSWMMLANLEEPAWKQSLSGRLK